MGTLENPLIHCHTIRDLLNRINRIHSELIDHENTLPKCEVCWQNHAEFNSIKAQILLIVHENVLAKDEESRPHFEYVQLQGEIQDSIAIDEVKEEVDVMPDLPTEEDTCKSDVDDEWNSWESSSEPDEVAKEVDAPKKKARKEKIACHFCSKTFYQGKRLTEHMARHTGEKPFKCETCGKTFKSLDYYASHCKSHEKNRTDTRSQTKYGIEENPNDPEYSKNVFECEFCGSEFEKKKQIAAHIRVHVKIKRMRKETLSTKPEECKICRKRYTTTKGLNKHMRYHKKTISDHKSTHVNEETPYPCEICKRFFRNSVTLERHKELRDNANLNCETCNEKFCRATDIYNHQRVVHKVKTAFQCRHCDEQFSNFRLIYRHHKVQHPKLLGPTRPFLCEMCGLTMVDSRDLNRHMMIHRGLKPHKCDMCDKTFRLQTEVEQHRRVHIPISQLQDLYACDMCPKKFRMKLTLWRHKRIHTGQITEMFCQVCRRRFINAKNLEIHMLKHANEAPRPFKCDICGKYFKIRKEYNLHMKRKHGIFALEKTRIRKKP